MTWKLRTHGLPCAAAVALALCCAHALADNGNHGDAVVHARLSGYEEVPSVSSKGNGIFRARIDRQTHEVDYEFAYEGLQGTVLQAHIHIGQRGVNGGITVWLCQSATNPAPPAVAATTPVCTSPAGSFAGRITAASVIGPGGAQQLGAGELEELVAALRAGVAYANVHTNISPGGEIRGQVHGGHRH